MTRTLLLGQRTLDDADEFIGRKGLQSDTHVEAVVFALDAGHSAQHYDRHSGRGEAQFADQIGTGASGQEVVRNHHTDLISHGAQEGEGAFSIGCNMHDKACAAQYGLPDAQLTGIVVDQQYLKHGHLSIFRPHLELGAMPICLVRAVLTAAFAIELVGTTANLVIEFGCRGLGRTHRHG
jgi:hypothetical protein